jgi:hypothetical protein
MLRTKQNAIILMIALLFSSSLAQSQASIDNMLPLLSDQDLCESQMGEENNCVNITDGAVYIKPTYDTLVSSSIFQSNNPAFESVFQNATQVNQVLENQGGPIDLTNANESGLMITNEIYDADYVLSFYPPISFNENNFYIFQIIHGDTKWLIKLEVSNGEIAASEVKLLTD